VFLAIDTSSDFSSIAIRRDDGGIEERILKTRRSSEGLLEVLSSFRSEGNPTGIALSIGPGSYTGIRIGLSLAQGLGLAFGVPVIGVSSLLAKLFLEKPAPGTFMISVPAREGESFSCEFEVGDTDSLEVAATTLISVNSISTEEMPLARGVLGAALAVQAFSGPEPQFARVSAGEPILPIYGKPLQAKTLEERGLVAERKRL